MNPKRCDLPLVWVHVKEFSSCVVKNKYICLEWLIIWVLLPPLFDFEFGSYECVFYLPLEVCKPCFCQNAFLNTFALIMINSNTGMVGYVSKEVVVVYLCDRNEQIWLSFYQKRKRFCYILLSILIMQASFTSCKEREDI